MHNYTETLKFYKGYSIYQKVFSHRYFRFKNKILGLKCQAQISRKRGFLRAMFFLKKWSMLNWLQRQIGDMPEFFASEKLSYEIYDNIIHECQMTS